jgi:hypothetical protein
VSLEMIKDELLERFGHEEGSVEMEGKQMQIGF